MSGREITSKDNEDIIRLNVADHIATITLNDPTSRNSLSRAMMGRIQEVLDEIAASSDIHVVIIEATGPVFSSGHNLKEVIAANEDDTIGDLLTQCCTMMQGVVNLPQPVIARVDGAVTAAGTQLVASCDLAYASDTSKFATSGVNFGLFCSTPMVALSRNVAPKQAMEMLVSGEFIDAPRAVEIGLVNAALPEGELDAHLKKMATTIASKSPYVLKLGKAAFYKQLNMPLDEAYKFTSGVMQENIASEDGQEGMHAFKEKRTPVWRGK